MEFDPWLQFTFYPPSYQFWEKERAAVETCQLPFTFTEECWQVFTMLSVSTPDKSPQFINKIDGISYHEFLLCVFPYRPYSQKHPRYLTSSYPLCPSPGMLRCFNIFHVQLSNHTTAGTFYLPRFKAGIQY